MTDSNLRAILTVELCWHYATVAQNKYLDFLVALLKNAPLDFYQNIINNIIKNYIP